MERLSLPMESLARRGNGSILGNERHLKSFWGGVKIGKVSEYKQEKPKGLFAFCVMCLPDSAGELFLKNVGNRECRQPSMMKQTATNTKQNERV